MWLRKHRKVIPKYEENGDLMCFFDTAADIVKVRKSTKSHVSISLKDLETKRLVDRIQSPNNKKRIKIVLLDDAIPIIEAGKNAQKQFAKNVLSGLTEEEMQMCIQVFQKICNNANECLKRNAERDDEKNIYVI